MKFKKYLWGVLCGFILTVFTSYVLLYTFVITRVYTSIPSEENNINQNTQPDNISPSPNTPDNTKPQSAGITDTTYQDDSISITITTYREKNTNIYSADIQVSSAEYLKTAFAQGVYGRNVTEITSEISKSNHAILAINGDYYGARESGYVLRNGVLYRSLASRTQEDLVVYQDGGFSIITEAEISAEQLLSDGAVQVLSFGPALITDRKDSHFTSWQNFCNHSVWKQHITLTEAVRQPCISTVMLSTSQLQAEETLRRGA